MKGMQAKLRGGKQRLKRKALLLQQTGRHMHAGQPGIHSITAYTCVAALPLSSHAKPGLMTALHLPKIVNTTCTCQIPLALCTLPFCAAPCNLFLCCKVTKWAVLSRTVHSCLHHPGLADIMYVVKRTDSVMCTWCSLSPLLCSVYERAFRSLRDNQPDAKEEAVMLLEAWRAFEADSAAAEQRQVHFVAALLPASLCCVSSCDDVERANSLSYALYYRILCDCNCLAELSSCISANVCQVIVDIAFIWSLTTCM